MADEWHLHTQIGKTFGGVLLTEEDCLRVESVCIAEAVDFHREAGLPDVYATGVEDHGLKGAPAEGALISADRLPILCRSMLREEYRCRITGGNSFFISEMTFTFKPSASRGRVGQRSFGVVSFGPLAWLVRCLRGRVGGGRVAC